MQKKLQAVFNNIIVKSIELETKGNIIIPDSTDENTRVGEIVSVGEGITSFSGDFLPTQLKEGMVVILPKHGFSRFEFQGQEYLLGKEIDVLSIILD